MSPPSASARVLSADGRINVRTVGLRRRAGADLYHRLLSTTWPRLMALVVAGYVAANALFAACYLSLGDGIANARSGSFSDAFFFSVQTMATIGYGSMAPRTLGAHLLVAVEALVGVLALAILTGLIFAKFSRPTARVMFSRAAVIGPHGGVPTLSFRIANERGNQVVEATLHVVLARNETTLEGRTMRRLHDLALLRSRNPLFALTWTVFHPITPDSPLAGMTPEALAASESEVIVSLTGLDETVAQPIHARRSYSAGEIACNARFVDIFRRGDGGERIVDYTKFHDVVPA